MDPALFPHAPVFIRKANTVVLWSTKSACSHIVLWAFLQDGLFREANAYSQWPHDYREKVYRKGPAFADPLQRLLDSGGAGHTLLKVTRDPGKRLVSIFRHACRFPFLYKEIHQILGFDVRREGLSLVDLDQVLRRLKLTPPTRANPHVRGQFSPVWNMGFDRIITLNIDEVPLEASLNAMERALGLEETEFGRLEAFAHLSETHYAKEGSFDLPQPIETHRFRRSETDLFPKQQLTASPLVESMARRLYRADYDGVGSSDTRGELFRPEDGAQTGPAGKVAPKEKVMVQAVPGASRPGNRSPERLAIAAIFKNEGPYIHDWIAHHRALGIERFFIADNSSTDETTANLAALAAAGIIDHIPFPTPVGRGPQQAAYERILHQYGSEADWIAFLDGDEFLVPADPHRSLAEVIGALDPGPDIGAIVVNWAVYGSSGHKEGGSDPVAARFLRRSQQSHLVNRHYKSIIRPGAFQGKVQNPHHFPLKEGFRSVHANGSTVADVPHLPKGLSRDIRWEPIRINHYVIKSWEEFYYRKRVRGRGTGASKQRDAAFFRVHDRNDVLDPMPAWLLAAAEEEGRRIERIVRERRSPKPAGGTLSAWRAQLRSRLHPPPALGGAIESVEIQGGSALIRGWALTPRKERVEGFTVAVDQRPAEVTGLIKTRRSDILLRFPGASADCGFNLKIAWPLSAEASRTPVPITVSARYNGESAFALAAAPDAAWRVIDMTAAPPPPKDPPAVPAGPSMPPAAVDALAEALRGVACYLEYGSGSTVFAAGLGVGTLIAVDSDTEGLKRVKDRLAAAEPDRLFLLHADIGPTKALGYPVSSEHWARYHTYPLKPWDLCRSRGFAPDLVLVDGRFRASCFLATLLFGRPGCRILFDDYADRPFYHLVTCFAEPARMIGRMAEFRVPEALDRDKAWETLLQATTDPR